MTEQLALFDLKQVTFAPVPIYTPDPSWDEITQQEDSQVGGHDEISGDECPPTIQVGDRVQLHCPFIPDHHPFGTLVSVSGQQAFVRWEPYGGSHINVEFLKVAPQLEAPLTLVGGHDETPGDGCPPTKNHAPQHGWIEEYLMVKGDNKYIYLRYVWREGKRKRKKYLGNVENPKARERVEMVRDAIALGKLPHEIVELI
ncbi:hypothetical protein [Calothrix rhizosoleniae]|uniref:hypothetical protein n=1 Tax=Calothrix rhizosoleniae TaxID=888997 RepID=UPI000B4994B1|nr:hypothetical protein [Calothrix rhizosoleniae]